MTELGWLSRGSYRYEDAASPCTGEAIGYSIGNGCGLTCTSRETGCTLL